ncbi:MAG: NACHT domain-containing protein, partial [bacterium]
MMMNEILCWEKLKEGKEYLFSFLFIDRVASTEDTNRVNAEKFHRIVEEKILSFNGKFIEWHGDATTGFFYTDYSESLLECAKILSKRATESALAIYEELITTREELRGYISIHLGIIPFKKTLGEIKAYSLDIGGHILKACPSASILIHNDVYDLLPNDLKGKFRYCGTTEEDKTPVFVYPKNRKIDKVDKFIPGDKDTQLPKMKYLETIKERYGKIIPKGLRQERIVSIDLFEIFSPLTFRTKEMEIFTPEEMIEGKDLTQKRDFIRRTSSSVLTLKEVLKRRQNAIILGSPGAGKSTLIKYLAISCREGGISIKERLGLDDALFPFPISIGHLSQIWKAENKQIGMKEAIIRYFKILNLEIAGFIDEEIERAIFLLDGMDEVPSDTERREIAGWIEAFIQSCPKSRFVITSRIIGFPGLSMENGETYFIEELTIEQAKPLIKKLMMAIEKGLRNGDEIGETIGMKEAERLIAVLEKSPQLSQFIANPFLLTLTVLIHKIEAQLPNYCIQLFERMIQTLVETWHQARSISIIHPEAQKIDFRTEAIPILSPLALWMHEGFPAGIIPEDNLRGFIRQKLVEKGIAKERIEESLNNFLERLKQGSGLLEEKGVGLWGFTHLSFEEYLSAVELVRDELYFDYLDEFFYAGRWEEVLILVASELGIIQTSTKRVSDYIERIFNGKRDEINEGILKKNVLLAGRCMANSTNVEIGLMDRITEKLIEFLFRGPAGLKSRAGRVLNEASRIERVRDKISKKIELSPRNPAIDAIGDLGIKEDWAIAAIKEGLRDVWVQSS